MAFFDHFKNGYSDQNEEAHVRMYTAPSCARAPGDQNEGVTGVPRPPSLATLPPTWSSHKLTTTHADSPVAVPSLVPSIAALVTIVADQTTIVRRQVHEEPSQLLSPQRWHQCGGRKEADRCAKSFFQQKNDLAQRRRLADAPEGRALALEQHAQRGASFSAAWFSSVRAPPGATRTSSGSSR